MKKNFMEKTLHDIMADFMVNLCEQKRHDEHICQPDNKLWIKNYKRFEGFIKSALHENYEQAYSDVCKRFRGREEALKKEIIKILTKAEINCSGSCRAGCEIAVQECIKKLKKLYDK